MKEPAFRALLFFLTCFVCIGAGVVYGHLSEDPWPLCADVCGWGMLLYGGLGFVTGPIVAVFVTLVFGRGPL